MTELENTTVVQGREGVLCLRCGAEVDRRAHAIAQLQVSRHKIGMEMGQEHMLDLQPVFGGEGEVPVDVTLRIDNRCGASLFIPDDVRSVG